MREYRPDRVVRVLNVLVSVAYFGLWAGAVLVLVAGLAARGLAGGNPDNWIWALEVPATLLHSGATVDTSWGPARLEVGDVRAIVQLPIATLPWWLVGVLWTHAAVAFALMLLFLHHLRRIFRRVRDGAPFDAENALRMRWLGLILLALAVFSGIAELATALAVRSGLRGGDISVAAEPHLNVPLVFVALGLIALAEIFRRGAELEDEQSLVI
jgi:hypothetical protein